MILTMVALLAPAQAAPGDLVLTYNEYGALVDSDFDRARWDNPSCDFEADIHAFSYSYKQDVWFMTTHTVALEGPEAATTRGPTQSPPGPPLPFKVRDTSTHVTITGLGAPTSGNLYSNRLQFGADENEDPHLLQFYPHAPGWPFFFDLNLIEDTWIEIYEVGC